jgi:esterase/lipase
MKKSISVLLTVLALVAALLCYWNLGWKKSAIDEGKNLSHFGASKNVSHYGARLLVKQMHHYRKKIDPRPMIKVSSHLPTLPPEVIRGVKKFVLFIGYPRSGHSIVGSILDAHPHMVISHEFMLMDRESLFSDPPTRNWTSDLFNVLYQQSNLDVYQGTRNRLMTEKGYTLHIDGLWQGKYDEYVDVIGDKSGGVVTAQFVNDPLSFEYNIKQLVARLPVPIKLVHVIRNPYDMISTATIYTIIMKDPRLTNKDFAIAKKSLSSIDSNARRKFVNETLLRKKIRFIFNKVAAAMAITEMVGEDNVLTIHNADLVHRPLETILRMCKFFELSAPDVYLDVTSKKVFSSISRTRELTEWPERLVAQVADEMKLYEVLNRYNFSSD